MNFKSPVNVLLWLFIGAIFSTTLFKGVVDQKNTRSGACDLESAVYKNSPAAKTAPGTRF
ncbi:hypothetical protein COO20_20915 [Thalassospira marina]|uniref:Uncharacterized protein n=2 Tax=Thalassospira marina TaxID=2048283 RepID=A0A2N3KJ88_9PROT|nr:hypothetical protein COO20_20915 [Thalassospira marina]